MIDQKLQACRFAYEQEFEFLAKQFEKFKDEVDEHRNKQAAVQEHVSSQEAQILQMNNMIEQVGRDMGIAESERRVEEPIEGIKQEELMDFVADLNDNPDAYMSETTEIVKSADKMLAEPFSFYGFGI